jgi:hypothetical protein
MPNSTSFEFVLALSEALARQTDPPSGSALELMATALLVPLEYEMLNRILCQSCAANEWDTLVRRQVAGRQEIHWPYAPAGDEHHCVCRKCGYEITVLFWFSL